MAAFDFAPVLSSLRWQEFFYSLFILFFFFYALGNGAHRLGVHGRDARKRRGQSIKGSIELTSHVRQPPDNRPPTCQ